MNNKINCAVLLVVYSVYMMCNTVYKSYEIIADVWNKESKSYECEVEFKSIKFLKKLSLSLLPLQKLVTIVSHQLCYEFYRLE